ncbi:catalase family peroxidase [Dyella tabacisoli]|uniref:Catalase-related peroxidase n=1 Tax=Dyella tabacisoli TaxID=2282381 RepID=A0A369UNN2_9GAMM|nr:catalase family peroxidase [Dyella tabacisoli]RDD81665.1 catalase [Dyella tabacisoli]
MSDHLNAPLDPSTHSPNVAPPQKDPQTPERQNRPKPGQIAALSLIGLILAAIAASFAYVAGWLTPQRLTASRFVDALQLNNGGIYEGYRRAHAKGVCFVGHFESNGQGVALSSASVFAAGNTPVIGRFATGAGNPHTPDGDVPVRSMALSYQLADGQVWRSGMNSVPFQIIGTPEAFYEFGVANRRDPSTGKPDLAKQQTFAATHPELKRFSEAMAHWPITNSFANSTFNGVNTFRFIDAQGTSHNVRWIMKPQAPVVALDKQALDRLSADFLSIDLHQRLQQGPLRFDLMVTEAQPGDPINDSSRPWPDDRPTTHVGTLVVERDIAQADGPCRDINFNPLILPKGIEPSDDPILAARGSVYSESFNRRLREEAAAHIPPAAAGGRP